MRSDAEYGHVVVATAYLLNHFDVGIQIGDKDTNKF